MEQKCLWKFFKKRQKSPQKNQNCGKTRANWAKPLFIQVSVTPNRVESGEISHSPKSLLLSVIYVSDSYSSFKTITLCNKDFGAWDISPDSNLLGVTDTWMKSVFAQLALVFPQFWVFEAIFDACGQNCHKLFYSVCTFYCTQNNRLDLTVSTQKSV